MEPLVSTPLMSKTSTPKGHPGTSLVLEGTQHQVDGYIANYVVERRNYLIPSLLIGYEDCS